MPRGKKELAEQFIPYAASVEVEVGRGKTFAESVKKIGMTDCLTRCPRPKCSSSGLLLRNNARTQPLISRS